MAGNGDETQRLAGLLQPLWETFKAFGSIRVVYMLVDHLSLGRAELPRPLLPLNPVDRQRVLDTARPLIDYETGLTPQSLL